MTNPTEEVKLPELEGRPNNAVLVPASELRKLQEDAARYEFLRKEAYEAVIPHGNKLNGKRTAWITKLHAGETFDAAIDAARQKRREDV